MSNRRISLKAMWNDFRKRTFPASVENFDSKTNFLERKIEESIKINKEIKKDLEIIKRNTKALSYQCIQQIRKERPVEVDTSSIFLGLTSRATRQKDYEEPWFAHWCQELKLANRFYRKLWEYAFLLQSMHDANLLKEGMRGLGFGCGHEPLPAYLASKGIKVTATDLHPDRVIGLGWAETGQHSETLDNLFDPDLVDRAIFDQNVDLEYVDMNHIPPELRGFDFCWSICALEHLGSIENGLAFIENSVETLKPGGWALHTTEFNCGSTTDTLDNAATVLFLRRDFEHIASRLVAQGHQVAPLDFDVGNDLFDQLVDIPPYTGDAHLKLEIAGFVSTCFGLAVRRSDS